MIALSSLIRGERIASLGFKRPQSWPRMVSFAHPVTPWGYNNQGKSNTWAIPGNS